MTVSLFAIMFNLTAIAAVLAASLFLQQRYDGPFFRTWTRAYCFGAAVVLLETAGAAGLRPAWLVLQEAVAIFCCTWFYLQAALLLQPGPRSLPRRWLVPGAALWVSYAALMMVVGVPFNLISAAPVICLTIAICYLGSVLIRLSRPAPAFDTRWVGWPLVAMGLWPLSFPVLEHSPVFWVGGWVAGVLHLVVGFGMALFLLDESNAKVRRQNEELLQLDRMKGQFLAMVSHELRTPLMSLTGFLELLHDGFAGPLNPGQREYVEQMEIASDQLSALVESLLDTAQAESGVLRVKREEVDLAALVGRLDQALGVLADKREIRIVASLPPDLPLAWADAERVSQVLTNLIGNSLKFANRGSDVVIEGAHHGGRVQLSISDESPGIPEGAMESIFQPFYQLDSSSTRLRGGTGLGLAIARSLAHAMEGSLVAHSQVGRGTRFTLTLPAAGAAPIRANQIAGISTS